MTKLVINSFNRQVTIYSSDTALNCKTQSKKNFILNNVKLKYFDKGIWYLCVQIATPQILCAKL